MTSPLAEWVEDLANVPTKTAVSGKIGRRYGELILHKHFSKVDFYIEPYVRYWHLNASKVASGSVDGGNLITTDNKNSSVEAGTKIGVEF